jgi:hypothetical protein
MNDVHSCSYHCHRPACIKAQRDELRDKLAALIAERDDLLRALKLADAALSGSNMNMNVVQRKVQSAIEAAKRQEG